jgi:transcription termination factor Rho
MVCGSNPSTFDRDPQEHVKLQISFLKNKTIGRMWSRCGDLDSITRLAGGIIRYNLLGKVLSGGVDANALQKQNVSLERLVMLKMVVH